jgi:hypothetical protein
MMTLRKLWAVTKRLLWQNRWLLLLVMLWPCAMTVILLWPRGPRLQMDDFMSILHQEAFYGLALVGVAASTQLGREERSRRVLQVLSRSVSRGEYLAALALAAWLPLVGFVVSLVVNSLILAHELAASTPALPWYAVEQLADGALVAGAGLLMAVVLPPALATLATFGLIGLITAGGAYGVGGPGRVFAALGNVQLAGRAGSSLLDVLMTVVMGLALMIAAWLCFRYRDLRLSE